MAIDQEIQSKVDAYRSNPQALQQRYAQNQQLVDLLALQKIKSEMDAAKRDVQMQMQQQPGTIKQQREQELMQRTKQDMMDQTAGVMRQKQAQQQKNIQQVAQKGLGALAPQRPPAPGPAQQIANQSQPVPKMAAGGIVAFQEGGPAKFSDYFNRSTQKEGSALKEYLAGFGITNTDEWQRTPPEVKERILSAVNARAAVEGGSAAASPVAAEINDLVADPFKVLGNIGIAASNTGLGTALGLSDPRNPNQPFEYNTNRKKIQETIAANFPDASSAIPKLPAGDAQIAQGLQDPSVPALGTPPAPMRVAPDTGTGLPSALPSDPTTAMPKLGEPATAPSTTPAPTGAAANIPTESGGLAGLGVGVGGGSAEAAMERGFARADQYTGRDEKAGRYAEMEARLAELDKSMYDPADERRDQLKAFLIGAGGRGSTALAGGAAASMNLRADQKAERRQRLMDQFAIAERGMAVDADLAQVGLTLGREMYSQVSANNRAALSAAASLRNTELRNQMEAAKLQYTKRRDDADRDIRAQEVAVQAADAAARQSTADLGATSLALDRLLDVQKEELQRQFDAQGIDDLNVQLSFAADDAAAAALEQEIARRAAAARIDAQTILNESGVIDAQERLTMRLIDLTGIETGDLPELTMDDLDSVTYTE